MRYDDYALTRESRSSIAVEHSKRMRRDYRGNIEQCIIASQVYTGLTNLREPENRFGSTEVTLSDHTVEGYLNHLSNEENITDQDKVAVLNFASYKNPGGGFLSGMLAQEEALCHISTLYPVLDAFSGNFYYYNQKGLNKGLYSDRAIYSPDVVFELKDGIKYHDVITCAAPNLSPILRYNTVPMEQCVEAMRSRIDFIFRLAAHNKVDILILGAFGCGVFKNDPEVVASIMLDKVKEYDGVFKHVIHPIPGRFNSKNWRAFNKIMFGE